VLCIAAGTLAQQRSAAGGALVTAVLEGAERFNPEALRGVLPEPDLARLRRYAERRTAFRSQLGEEPGPGVEGAFAHGRRVSIERELVALIERPGIEAEAAAAARAARPAYPDGGSDPARYAGEVAWAEAWLRANPGSALAPFHYAYIAWMLRAGIEQNEDRALREHLARKYRTMLTRLTGQPDRIWALLAADIDGAERVGAGGLAHPREFLAHPSHPAHLAISPLPTPSRSPAAAPARPASRCSGRRRSPCHPCRRRTC
jgi:hypothetical protein